MNELGYNRRGFLGVAGLGGSAVLLSRPTLLFLTSVFLLSACQPIRHSDDHGLEWKYDPKDESGLVHTYAKITGTTDSSQIYLQYYGEIIALLPGEVEQPLFRLKGLVRQRWTPNDDGSYTYSNYDHGLFCDWETGEVLEEYNNPFTGETNDPLHYNSGPLIETIGLGEGQTNPVNKDWHVTGNQVTVSASKIGRAFNNPVQPEKYPLASTGTKVRYSWMSTYFANTEDLADANRPGVGAHHTWVFLTNFPAWMKMGDRSGYVLWRWSAKKFSDEAEIDPYILSEVEKRKPGFLTVKEPWPLRSDGWTQYSRERQPD